MFKTYRNTKMRTRRRFFVVEARPYVPGEDLGGVDTRGMQPQQGDMVARNRDEHAQIWIVAAGEFESTYEAMP